MIKDISAKSGNNCFHSDLATRSMLVTYMHLFLVPLSTAWTQSARLEVKFDPKYALIGAVIICSSVRVGVGPEETVGNGVVVDFVVVIGTDDAVGTVVVQAATSVRAIPSIMVKCFAVFPFSVIDSTNE
jgi:hypothetical protein